MAGVPRPPTTVPGPLIDGAATSFFTTPLLSTTPQHGSTAANTSTTSTSTALPSTHYAGIFGIEDHSTPPWATITGCAIAVVGVLLLIIIIVVMVVEKHTRRSPAESQPQDLQLYEAKVDHNPYEDLDMMNPEFTLDETPTEVVTKEYNLHSPQESDSVYENDEFIATLKRLPRAMPRRQALYENLPVNQPPPLPPRVATPIPQSSLEQAYRIAMETENAPSTVPEESYTSPGQTDWQGETSTGEHSSIEVDMTFTDSDYDHSHQTQLASSMPSDGTDTSSVPPDDVTGPLYAKHQRKKPPIKPKPQHLLCGGGSLSPTTSTAPSPDLPDPPDQSYDSTLMVDNEVYDAIFLQATPTPPPLPACPHTDS